MPSAEVLTIGTEILLGEIVDTNASNVATALKAAGVDLYHASTVGDNIERITASVRQAISRSDILVTTGGLGPTVDDPTREAVALALGSPLEFREDLWEQVVARFARFGRAPTENNRRQAFVPRGARAVENPVGTAPAFLVERGNGVVICLPGVPREMEYLLEHSVLPYLRERFKLSAAIVARVLHTAGEGESALDDLIADLETLPNPTVGLAAHAGQVDVRVTAKAGSLDAARAMIAPLEAELHRRLGDRIYGIDEETLEGAALARLAQLGWRVTVCEDGLGGNLAGRLAAAASNWFVAGQVLSQSLDLAGLKAACARWQSLNPSEVCLGAALQPGIEKQTLHIVVTSPVKENAITRTYGGPPAMASHWATNLALDVLRRLRGRP
jgi:competence/damage-inducible protein CinA-like protein